MIRTEVFAYFILGNRKHGKRDADHNLRNHFLPPDQPQIALPDNLDIVVHKANQHTEQGKNDDRESEINRGIPNQMQGQCDDCCDQRKNESAHGYNRR